MQNNSRNTLFFSLIVAFLAIFIGYKYYNYGHLILTNFNSRNSLLQNIYNSLDGITKETSKEKNKLRIAVGYNANLDLIVNGMDLIKVMRETKKDTSVTPQDTEKIKSLEEFLNVFAFYFQRGSAAERVVEPKSLFNEILEYIEKIPDYKKHWFTGGNAALMANRFVTENCEVMLGGVVGSKLSKLLHPNVKLAQNQQSNSEVILEDEIHLILEYEKGAKWGDLIAPRANRFIITCDETNSQILPMESFHSALPSFQPSLVVLSGFHLLEGNSVEFQEKRLQDAVSHLQDTSELKEDIPVHLELASVGNLEFLKRLVKTVAPMVNSLGLNEQELGSTYVVLGGAQYNRNDFKDPTPRAVIDAIKYILETLYSIEPDNTIHHLTRVHFHCLHFHLIVHQKHSEWSNSLEAVASGSLAATRQACDQYDIDFGELEMNAPLQIPYNKNKFIIGNSTHPILHWEESVNHTILQFYYSPVLVCKTPKKTVGLGDAISSVGLVASKFQFHK